MYFLRGFLFVLFLAILGVPATSLGIVFLGYIVWPGMFKAAQILMALRFWKRPRHGVQH